MRSKFQKVLDKQLQTLYNNRCKVKRMKTAEQILVDLTESVNKERSKTTDENIHLVGEAIKRARDKGFGSLRTPILAGGVVRDYVYGLTPNDYDIFLDVSSIPEDEQEDAVLLFGLRVIDELTAADDSKFKALEDNTLRKLGVDNPYGDAIGNTQAGTDPRWKNFYVFETGPFNERIQRIWNEDVAEDANRANDMFRFIKLQFIGHNDTRLSQEDPTEFVEYFDYELVRCLFDPEVMAYRLHDDFVKVVNSKEITVTDRRTRDRVIGWTNNFAWANLGERLQCPIKVIDNSPKSQPFELKMSTMSARSLLQAAQDQQFRNALGLLQNIPPAPPAQPILRPLDWQMMPLMNDRRVRILNEDAALRGWQDVNPVNEIPLMPPAVPIIDLEPEEAPNENQDAGEARAWDEF